MRMKWIYGILAISVCTLLLMQSVQGVTNAIVWQWQATLSTADNSYGQDPENYGYGTTQVVVWEEQVGINNQDISMKYSLLDGAPGSWLFPLFQPATTVQWERNPAVSVTPSTGGSTEIHIVYEREDLVQGVLTWRIYHVYTNNFGAAWIGPVLMNSVARANAYDPAIVCTEDLATPGGGGPGFLNQMVWSEETGFATGVFQILYDAHIYDPTLLPARPYVGPTIIRTNPNVGIIYGCYKPEIASVDERSNAVAYDFPFAIAWEETWPSGAGIPAVRYDIYYVDGTTTTSPGVPATALTAGSIGIISNPLLAQVDAREPDIAASQDYPAPGAVEQYYYHIVWVSKLWPNAGGGAYGNSVEHSYTCGITPWPGFAAFIAGLVPVTGPSVIQAYDNPTVALKLQNVVGPVFDSWFAWEDTSGPSPMDIYYRPGRYTVGGPPFVFRAGPAIVPYAQGNSVENNPEFWNRNDPTRNLPPNSHLVFDMNPNPITTEVEYIDP